MKAKIQIGTGLFAAIFVSVGIIIQCITIAVKRGSLEIGYFILLALLCTYFIAIIMKKRTLSKIIVFLWCSSWIVPFIVYFMKDALDMYNHLVALLLVWPYFVSQQFFFGRPYFANGMHAVAFGGGCILLIAVLLWIGTLGANQLVKAENKLKEDSSSEQKQ